MDEARDKESFPRTPLALGVLTVIVYVAGFAMVGAWFMLVVLGQPRAAGTAPVAAATPRPAAAAPDAAPPGRTPSPGPQAARAR